MLKVSIYGLFSATVNPLFEVVLCFSVDVSSVRRFWQAASYGLQKCAVSNVENIKGQELQLTNTEY